MSKIETTLTVEQARIAEALFAGSYGVTLGKRAGNATSIPVPVADMPQAAILRMFEYGVQRTFNDRVGGSDTTLEQKIADAKELVAAFLRGEVRTARAGGTSDPVLDAVLSLIRPQVKAALGAEAWKAMDEAERLEKLEAVFDAQNDEAKATLRAAGEKEVERKKAEAKAKAEIGSGISIKL